MKTTLAILLVLFTTTVSAEDWRDPHALFNAKKREISKSTITWQLTDNVQKTCEAESRKRGNKGFGYPVSACSFWSGDTCTIITGTKTTTLDMGHELRHCFQGSFH
jgi:hypothetical protein